MNRLGCSGVLHLAAGLSVLGTGACVAQVASRDANSVFVISTMVLVEQCVKADTLLRKVCGRIGPNPPDAVRASCELPAVPFETRAAHAYGAFREANQATIARSEPEVSRHRAEADRLFESQFSQLRSGAFSSTDLFRLNAAVAGDCRTAERLLGPMKPRR